MSNPVSLLERLSIKPEEETTPNRVTTHHHSPSGSSSKIPRKMETTEEGIYSSKWANSSPTETSSRPSAGPNSQRTNRDKRKKKAKPNVGGAGGPEPLEPGPITPVDPSPIAGSPTALKEPAPIVVPSNSPPQSDALSKLDALLSIISAPAPLQSTPAPSPPIPVPPKSPTQSPQPQSQPPLQPEPKQQPQSKPKNPSVKGDDKLIDDKGGHNKPRKRKDRKSNEGASDKAVLTNSGERKLTLAETVAHQKAKAKAQALESQPEVGRPVVPTTQAKSEPKPSTNDTTTLPPVFDLNGKEGSLHVNWADEDDDSLPSLDEWDIPPELAPSHRHQNEGSQNAHVASETAEEPKHVEEDVWASKHAPKNSTQTRPPAVKNATREPVDHKHSHISESGGKWEKADVSEFDNRSPRKSYNKRGGERGRTPRAHLTRDESKPVQTGDSHDLGERKRVDVNGALFARLSGIPSKK